MGELVEALASKRAAEPAVVGMPRAEAVMKTSWEAGGTLAVLLKYGALSLNVEHVKGVP